MNQSKPQIGISVIVTKGKKVLLGKRQNSHGNGMWGFPGGHLEHNESWEECAIRETMEETNITIKNIHYVAATNDLFRKDQKHYVTLFMRADHSAGNVTPMEPKKCTKWQWFSWSALPKPLFLPIENLLKQQYDPFDHSK